jgi:hypothetical protein
MCSYFHRSVSRFVVVVVVVTIKKCDEGIGQDDLKMQRPYNRTESYAECKNKSETSNNPSSWNHLQVIQKICDQHTWKA